MLQFEFVRYKNKIILRGTTVGGLRLLKVLKNTTNMFSKCNILLQEPSTFR
jgi:hypothetical protein